MKKLLFILFISSSVQLFAQKSNVSGTIKEITKNETLIGVNVSVQNSTIGTTSDLDGKYELSLEPGAYTIIFTYTGYDSIIKKINIKKDKNDILDIVMGEAPSMLDEVVVTSSKFERKIGEESVSIDIIKPAALEKQNLNNVSDVLQRSSGVTVVDGQANIRGGSGYSYGAGSRVLLLLDDLPILQADAGFLVGQDYQLKILDKLKLLKVLLLHYMDHQQ
jgi:hypothetical protein